MYGIWIQKGTIRKVGAYYRSSPMYQGEVLNGVIEFFGANNISSSNTDHPLFNEWMMYDFKFSDGKTMLEKFYNENPLNIPDYRREIYKTLIENYYGLFEVLEVRRFIGLTMKRLSDGKTFEVSEVSATMELDKGDVFIARVARVENHYELVGADTQMIKLSELKDEKQKRDYLEDIFPKIRMETPKDAFAFVLRL